MRQPKRQPKCPPDKSPCTGEWGTWLWASNRIATSLIAGLALLTGCSPSTDRLGVGGKVTLDGVPLSGGSIRFTSTGEAKTSGGAMVNDGQYEIPQEKGLLPGTYRVELNAPDESAQPVAGRTPGGAGGGLAAPERIPPEYNENSTHTIDVTVDGDNQFDFEIVSKRGRG